MIESLEFTVTEAAAYATSRGRRISPHGLRKLGRLGAGPRREFDPGRKAWLYQPAAIDAWIAEQRAKRTTAPVSQPPWLQSPEVRARAAAAATERRRILRGDREVSAA